MWTAIILWLMAILTLKMCFLVFTPYKRSEWMTYALVIALSTGFTLLAVLETPTSGRIDTMVPNDISKICTGVDTSMLINFNIENRVHYINLPMDPVMPPLSKISYVGLESKANIFDKTILYTGDVYIRWKFADNDSGYKIYHNIKVFVEH